MTVAEFAHRRRFDPIAKRPPEALVLLSVISALAQRCSTRLLRAGRRARSESSFAW
jgi:hypothetical protein